MHSFLRPTSSLVVLSVVACGAPPSSDGVVARFPVSDLRGVIDREGVALDRGTSADGNGAIRIDVDAPRTVRLYELDTPELNGSRLLYHGRLRAENVQGSAYLEMWCRFGADGEYFSRALRTPLTGTTDWVRQETPFFLEEGQVPDHVRLNVVVAGSGTVWVDDLALAQGGD